MNPEPFSTSIGPDELVATARRLRAEGYRLVQVGATRTAEQLELTYSFDLDSTLKHLRLALPAGGARLPSITSVYWCAFLYENELHDLFGIQVDGLAVDFHGTFYQTAIPFPFGSTRPPALSPSTRTQAPAAGLRATRVPPGPSAEAPHPSAN